MAQSKENIAEERKSNRGNSTDRVCNEITIRLEDIIDPQDVIHPALDWVNGQLIVGANLKSDKTAVLSSTLGLIEPKRVGLVCKQGKNFNGAVSINVAREFTRWLGTSVENRRLPNGERLLRDMSVYLSRFMVFPRPWWPDVLASWILGTYMYPVFQTYPYLWITSLEPGCGKSLLGDIISKLAFQGEFMTAPTEAQMFRLPETSRGVQVWDEVERKEESERKKFGSIQAVLLNGYRNGGAVPRQIGHGYDESAKFHVFCPRVLIGLSELPSPAIQRTIKIQLKKRTSQQRRPDQYIGTKQRDEERSFREQCLLWTLKLVSEVDRHYQSEELRNEVESLVGPGRVSDDIWLPVFALASAATAGKGNVKPNLRKAAPMLLSQKKMGAPHLLDRTDTSADVEFLIKKTALDILEWKSPVEPRQLAEHVSKFLEAKITDQRLGKTLSKIGIRTSKANGRRVYSVSKEAIASSRSSLNGTGGQQGQEQTEEAVTSDLSSL